METQETNDNIGCKNRKMNPKEMEKAINKLPPTVMRDLEKQISDVMAQSGLFCRVFSRQKSGTSAVKKITAKKKVQGEDYKMQDLFGVRIALYFKDDIQVCREIIYNR